MVSGAVYAALIAAFGNGLQGWDNAAIAGSLLYITPEFKLEDSPQVVGAIVAASLIGSVLSTFVAGPAADWIGRKSLLVGAAATYAVGAAFDGWAPSVNILIIGRGLAGFSIGLIATIAPLYIAETSPPEIRGQLATLPQLLGIVGMLLAYGMVFSVSLLESPKWRFMLSVSLGPALFYFFILIFVLPESPPWLVSKGRMKEARKVLVKLRNTEDVAGEMSFLVEGLGVGGDAHLEEWLLKPSDSIRLDEDALEPEAGQMRLFGPEPGVVWIASPMIKDDVLGDADEKEEKKEPEKEETSNLVASLSQLASSSFQVNQLVALMGEIQAAKEGQEADAAREAANSEAAWAEDVNGTDVEVGVTGTQFEGLRERLLGSRVSPKPSPRHSPKASPFVSRQSSQRDMAQNAVLSESSFPPNLGTSTLSGTRKSGGFEALGATSVGGGWQLAWQMEAQAESESTAKDRSGVAAEDGFRRVFMLQEPSDLANTASTLALPGASAAGEVETIQAQVLVTQNPQLGKEFLPEDVAGPAMVHPAQTAVNGPAWAEILEPGVRQALIVGVVLQFLQQACGINAVMYYTPTILMDSGASMLEQLGLSTQSSSILASAATTGLMLPCIFLAMWLMDRSGRRQLLLTTIPLMTASLATLSFSMYILTNGSLLQSIFSLTGVALFSCSFVTGFGPIPNIVCSEIFPTRVRGACIGLCAATMWGTNILVSQAFPAIQNAVGLGGVFSLFGIMSIIAWLFIYFRVPETKGLPLEVISEIFAMSARAQMKAGHEKEG